MTKDETRFPRTLYTSPGKIKWGSKSENKSYDDVIVNDEDELAAAEKAGYVDSFHDALFAEIESDELTKSEIMGALDDLGIEYNSRDKKSDLQELLEIAEAE